MSERRWLGLAAACLLLVVGAAAARAGERNYWQFDKGHYENTSGNRWTEKNQDRTYHFVETKRTEQYVELRNEENDWTERLYADHAEWKPSSNSAWRNLFDGRWVDR